MQVQPIPGADDDEAGGYLREDCGEGRRERPPGPAPSISRASASRTGRMKFIVLSSRRAYSSATTMA